MDPIAIVGRGCVLPGALTPARLGELSLAGEVVVDSVPQGRWRLAPERAIGIGSDRTWSDRGGYVRGFEERFDPRGFAVDAEQVAALDPLFRWSMHAAREALREAGLWGERRRGAAILGNLSFPTAGHAAFAERVWLPELRAQLPAASPFDRFQSGLLAAWVTRAAGLEDTGSLSLDAACASSLYAIGLACRALIDRRADVALAGAVNCADDLFIHVGFCALEALSRSGRSRPLSAHADGLVPAEGAAIVALMRLRDAIDEGRPVLGVIRGLGLCNDGRARSFLAPAALGQARAMQSALRDADWSPSDVSWIEAHATGTKTGDAVEVESTQSVYGSARSIAIGSLKANLGHAITAAGAAGLLRVLASFESGLLAPTPGIEEPLDALAKSCLRPLFAPEPWQGARRAAISAFGFGGNDAHLLVEAWEPASAFAASTSVMRRREITSAEPIAISGLGARVAHLPDTNALARALAKGDSLLRPRAGAKAAFSEEVAIGLDGLRSPPRDLEQALAQQTLLFAAALEAVPSDLPPDSTSVLVGMQCDCEVARWGARWRAAELGLGSEAQSALAPPLEAAMVLGTMPNIPANRLNRQLDLRGPSYTLSAGETSGLYAMAIAIRALRAGEIDAAVVGAVDLSCEPVHEEAARAIGIGDPSGDAALVLVLERESDARAKGRAIFAIVDEVAMGSAPASGPLVIRERELRGRFGHAHAASGLLAVVIAALELGRRGAASAIAVVEPFAGAHAWARLSQPDGGAATPSSKPPSRTLVLRTHPPKVMLDGKRLEPAPIIALGDLRVVPHPRDLPERRMVPPNDVAIAPPRTAPATPAAAALAALHGTITAQHRAFLDEQAKLHTRFLEIQARAFTALGRGPHDPPPALPGPQVAPAPIASPLVPSRAPTGPTFGRAKLEVHASGAISSIFGSAFEPQDSFRVQVRMPEPPLLLCDRVTGLTGDPASMGTGTVWTETDVRANDWYLHAGRMPAGLMIEAGQADLFLISWLGADLLNRGERRYRLLGCQLTWHRAPPRAGETLSYDIHIDGHAQQGDVRLFFFHYDCHIGPELALSVRGGQAGFFTEEELASSAGVLWKPEEQSIREDARLDPPALPCPTRGFDAQALRAFAAGDAAACFGPGFERARTHVRTPRIAQDELQFLETIELLDPRGGPWRRGYLRARTPIDPGDWFFSGHFKNDPCMPGTLMLEGCLQAMAFYLSALGYTLDRDGWRFQPVTGERYTMICRGQVIPSSRELTYELFVEEVHDGPCPRLYADLLCTVDGLPAFHARRMGLELVPDHPLSSAPEIAIRSERCASLDGLPLNERALLASARGQPSHAFGPRYAIFDGLRRAPRLPGPPYHFVSRVEQVSGTPWSRAAGASVVMAYDVPPDAWYFDDGASGRMPYAVLNEIALQPCGWLASYAGCALSKQEDLLFRNLDGKATVLAEIDRDAGTLRTSATLRSVSDSASMIIVAFDVVVRAGERDVYRLETTFGFFPPSAFEGQAGLPREAHHDALRMAPGRPATPDALSQDRLRLFDTISYCDPEAGRAGLGAARAERRVDPGDWYFKAHFFQDPVQPGSLGLEAMLELLRAMAHRKNMCPAGARLRSIALERPHRWKYRGQVRPEDGAIAVTLEVTAQDERLIEAEASLWVGERRIYEATLALDLAPATAWERPRAIEPALAWWRKRLARTPIPHERLVHALLSRFVGRAIAIDPDALAQCEGPILFVANHQTALETLLFAVLAAPAGDRPLLTLAKAEHRGSWFGELIASLTAGTPLDDLVVFFERADPAALSPLLDRAFDRLEREGLSLLLHLEGTRATSCRAPLGKTSAVPIEKAIERQIPIVPVRFSGGLPIDPVDRKLDFPFGLAAQDIWIGPPITAASLAPLSYGARAERVRAAIEALGPPRERETPNPGDAALEARLNALPAETDRTRALLALLETPEMP